MKVYPTTIIKNTNYQHPSKKLSQPSMQGLKPSSPKNLDNYKKPMGYSAAAVSMLTAFCCFFRAKNPTEYMKTLAKSMSEDLGKEINPNRLVSVLDGKELLEILPKLSKENYTYTSENIEKGIFLADLHSHSKHSDGNGDVKTLLENAADYADKLYEKTQRPFIFALTDHDTMEGCKEALKIIAENPTRYKNLQFVPAMEVSFAHSAPRSSNPCEMSEVLVYGVNPYSEKVSNFVNNIKSKRENMVKNFITEIKTICPLTNFSFDEFSKYYEFKKYGNLMNIHWRAYHYVQTKHAATIHANQIGKNPEEFFNEIMKGTDYPSIPKLRESGKLNSEAHDNPLFRHILDKFAPHFENGQIIAKSENSFEEVIDTFKDEPNVFMSFAHPYYFTEYTGTIQDTLEYFVENSKGLIKASESYHQAYTSRVNPKTLEKIHKETEMLNLQHIGGRDNHDTKLF